MHYAKVKRDKIGQCNICLKERPLSWDHVPPQGSYNPSPREVQTVMQVLTARDPVRPSTRDSQNGVKFRTICKPCNEKLGQDVDPTYIDFTQQIGLFLKSTLALPTTVSIKTKPARLIRAVLAHLVAAKVELDDVIFDRDVRPACRSLTVPIPDNVHVHYWAYPHEEQVILRDVATLAKRGKFGGAIMFFHLMKSYPVAFLVSDVARYDGLPTLTDYRSAGPDDVVDIPLVLSDIRPVGWPETPTDDSILFGGQAMLGSVVARPRKP